MRHEFSIKEAIDLALENLKLKEGYREHLVTLRWEEIVGKFIASRTAEVRIFRKKMYLRLSSAALKQELIYDRVRLISLVNEYMNGEVINEVIFL